MQTSGTGGRSREVQVPPGVKSLQAGFVHNLAAFFGHETRLWLFRLRLISLSWLVPLKSRDTYKPLSHE